MPYPSSSDRQVAASNSPRLPSVKERLGRPLARRHSRTGFALAGTLALSLCLAGDAFADPSRRGRAADGRAFRVDKEGLRITDYIAELEVTNDDLQRQVHALEDELDEKRARLEQAGAGTPPPPVKESSLIAKPQPDLDCSKLVAPLRAQIQQLQAAEQQRQLAAHDGVSQAQQQVRELERSLEQTRSQEARTDTESKRLAADLAQARQQLDDRDIRIADLQAKIDSLNTRLSAPPPVEARAALSRHPEGTVAKVEAPPAPVAHKPPPPAAEPAPALSIAEIAPVRAELNQTLEQIQTLIIQRKDLADSVGKRGRGISIQLKPLVAADGSSLDALRTEVRKLSSGTAIDTVRTGLAQIHRILQDDIDTLRRLKSL